MTPDHLYDAFNDNLHLLNIIDGSEEIESIKAESNEEICNKKSGEIPFSETSDIIKFTPLSDLKIWEDCDVLREMEKPFEMESIYEYLATPSRAHSDEFQNHPEDFTSDTTTNLPNFVVNILENGSFVLENSQPVDIPTITPPISLHRMRTTDVHPKNHSNHPQEYYHGPRINQRSWTNGSSHLPPSMRMSPAMRNILLSEILALNMAKQNELQTISSTVSSMKSGQMIGSNPQDQRRFETMIFQNRFCVFCKTNGEPPMIYNSHVLRTNGKVVCPLLKMHSCEICGARGENAHTRTYCPHYNAAVHGMVSMTRNSRHCKQAYISPHATENFPQFHQNLNINYLNCGQQNPMENHVNSYEHQFLINSSNQGWNAANCGSHIPDYSGYQQFIDPFYNDSHQDYL